MECPPWQGSLPKISGCKFVLSHREWATGDKAAKAPESYTYPRSPRSFMPPFAPSRPLLTLLVVRNFLNFHEHLLLVQRQRKDAARNEKRSIISLSWQAMKQRVYLYSYTTVILLSPKGTIGISRTLIRIEDTKRTSWNEDRNSLLVAGAVK